MAFGAQIKSGTLKHNYGNLVTQVNKLLYLVSFLLLLLSIDADKALDQMIIVVSTVQLNVEDQKIMA